MNRFQLLLLMLLLRLDAFSQGNPLVFRHLTVGDGLVSNFVQCIYQDSRGYIWIGTMDGLQRYDGHRFTTYRTKVHDPEALQSDWISVIFEDSHHRLWFGSDAGDLYLFNRSTEKFYNYRKHPVNGNNLTKGIYGLKEDRNGDIWVSSGSGIFRLNASTNQFENCNSLAGLAPRELPIVMTNDKEGNIWFSTNKGILFYHCGERKFYDRRHPYHHGAIFAITGNIPGLQFDDNGNTWVTRQAEMSDNRLGPAILYRIDAATDRAHTYTFDKILKKGSLAPWDKELPTQICRDNKGNIFVLLAWTGIAYYSPVADSFTITTINNESPHGLHSNYDAFGQSRPLVDKEGNIWIGTDKGINIVNPEKQYFHYYGFNNDYRRLSDFPPYEVSHFLQTPEDGDVYIAYYAPHGGILRLDSHLKIKKRYFYPDNISQPLGENQLWTFFRDKQGLIWVPTQAKSILKLDPKNEKLTRTVDSSLYGYISALSARPNGDIWGAHWSKGLIRIDRVNGRVTSFTQAPAPLITPVSRIKCFYQDEDGTIWAGNTEQGLLKFNIHDGKYTRAYLYEEGRKTSISSNYITDIVPYNRDTLLIATNTGINIFDKKKEIFTTITAQDGLPSNHVVCMMIDDKHRLWAACLKGFCRIDVPTGRISAYDVNEGLPEDVFTAPMVRISGGRYLMGQGKGFVVFDPDSINEKTPPPNVTITGCRVADLKMMTDSLVNTGTPLKLSYKDNDISIDFAALQFYGSSNIKYLYQLEGVDRGWVVSGREQTARYPQLKGGDYLFRVKCINRDGMACEKETTLLVRIVPPFWQTWWFILLVAVLVAALVFSIGRWLRDRKKEKEMLQLNYEKKIAIVEMNTLRAQMNPHFIFNSLNSINTFILKNDSENATEYLVKFSQLVRLILDNSRTEWVSLDNELKALALYVELEALRLDNSFTYVIDAAPELLQRHVVIPPLIIQPYVENAIWHGILNRKGPGGHMKVDIRKEAGKLVITIEDNGIGREEALKILKNRKHRSHGMNITAERLAIVNDVYNVHASVNVEDKRSPQGNALGTKVVLSIDYRTSADMHT